jgi:hypothetical protein
VAFCGEALRGLAANTGNGSGAAQESSSESMVFYVAFIIPTSTTEEGLRIDDPQPKECNVR